MERAKKLTVTAIVLDLVSVLGLSVAALGPVSNAALFVLVALIVVFSFDLARAISFYCDNFR